MTTPSPGLGVTHSSRVRGGLSCVHYFCWLAHGAIGAYGVEWKTRLDVDEDEPVGVVRLPRDTRRVPGVERDDRWGGPLRFIRDRDVWRQLSVDDRQRGEVSVPELRPFAPICGAVSVELCSKVGMEQPPTLPAGLPARDARDPRPEVSSHPVSGMARLTWCKNNQGSKTRSGAMAVTVRGLCREGASGTGCDPASDR